MCNFYRKTPVLESLFIKKRTQHRCFPVNIAKFLRTPIWKNICRRLLLCKLVLLAVYRQDKYSRKQETTKTFTAMKKNIERHQRKIWVIRKFCWSKTLKNWDKFSTSLTVLMVLYAQKKVKTWPFVTWLQVLRYRCSTIVFVKFLFNIFKKYFEEVCNIVKPRQEVWTGSHALLLPSIYKYSHIWDKVFKNGPSKIF